MSILRELIDAARDGLLALDENGVIVEANEAAARRLRRGRGYVVGKPFATLVPLEQRREFRAALAARNGAGPTRLEIPVEGERVVALLRPVPESAPPRAVVVIPADPETPLPLGVEAGAAAAARIDRFYRRLPYAVVGIGPDLRVAFANQRARQLLGRDAVRVGRPIGPSSVPVDLHAWAERVVALPAALPPATLELEDGRTLRLSGIGASETEPAVLILEDATAQYRHDRVMREFVRNAAHQLRTPLTGITTAIEVLQAGAKEAREERDRFLRHIETHAARLTRIARGLLVLARAQSGEQVLRLEFVELEPLLESLVAGAERTPGVTVALSCPTGLAALAESNLVHEALAALVDNAIDHTRVGTVAIAAYEADDRVSIEVSDSGTGVLPEHRGRIFEPFYRVADTGEGFGLGLAIAAQAVRAMNGELRAGESPYGGTTFAIELPSARVMV